MYMCMTSDKSEGATDMCGSDNTSGKMMMFVAYEYFLLFYLYIWEHRAVVLGQKVMYSLRPTAEL